jgi:superfamily II DNA or RNA helicase
VAGEAARGLGKLLVVAPDQAQARRYLDHIRARLPERRRLVDARLAVSDERDAAETLAAFRLLPEPAILVTVAMAYEGLDAPSVAVVASLTHIRSRPWLEQMIARATRVDPDAGPWAAQRATVFHPDDLMFRAFRRRIETEQGTVARQPKERPKGGLPPWLRDQLTTWTGPASCRSPRTRRAALRAPRAGARPSPRRRRPRGALRPASRRPGRRASC